MTTEAMANEADESAQDLSALPASAFPEGVDPSAYAAGLKAAPEETTEGARPAHIPEKFWDAEKGTVDTDAMAKSYAELEQRLRTPAKPEGEAEGEKSLKIEKAEEPVLNTAFEAFQTAFDANSGKVSDEDIAAIVKAGIPQKYVETYLAGLEAIGQQTFSKAYEIAGGEEAFNSAMTWAQSKLSAPEIDAYNAMVENPATMQQGIEWLTSKFKAANPSEGSFIETQSGGLSGDVFRSKSELIAAMSDPRYDKNEAFRTDVAEKLARSKSQGTFAS